MQNPLQPVQVQWEGGGKGAGGWEGAWKQKLIPPLPKKICMTKIHDCQVKELQNISLDFLRHKD